MGEASERLSGERVQSMCAIRATADRPKKVEAHAIQSEILDHSRVVDFLYYSSVNFDHI